MILLLEAQDIKWREKISRNKEEEDECFTSSKMPKANSREKKNIKTLKLIRRLHDIWFDIIGFRNRF